MSAEKDASKEEKRRRKQEKKDKKKRKRERSVEPSSSSNVNKQKVDQDYDVSDYIVSKSPFQKKKVSLMISLTPESLSNTTKHLHASMQSMLLKYSDGLGGVLISFDNIQLDKSKNDGSYGRIINEFPHIHYYITCDVLVFNPEPSVATSLKGVVNEVFPSHVGLLVHELFNASISAEHLRESGFSFDADLNEWTKDDTHNPINEGDDIEVSVDKLHECNGLISLECKDPVVKL